MRIELMGRWAVVTLVVTSLAFISPSAHALEGARKFNGCKAVWKVYPNGVAESRQAARDAIDLGYERPTISGSVYRANYMRLDDEYLGVICPRMSGPALGEFLLDHMQQDICKGMDAMRTPMNQRPSYCQPAR